MFLIYVSARKQGKKKFDPAIIPQDLKPIVIGLHHEKRKSIIREFDTRDIELPMPRGYGKLERLFVKIREADAKHIPGGTIPPELERLLQEGTAQLAVALATTFFGKGKAKPQDRTFADYVIKRSRIADKILVVGYTDRDCSLAESEILALDRAEIVTEILQAAGLDIPVMVVSRPACLFAPTATLSRRVEVAALYRGSEFDQEFLHSMRKPQQPVTNGRSRTVAAPKRKAPKKKKVARDKILEPVA